jgi:hypothetical protein
MAAASSKLNEGKYGEIGAYGPVIKEARSTWNTLPEPDQWSEMVPDGA